MPKADYSSPSGDSDCRGSDATGRRSCAHGPQLSMIEKPPVADAVVGTAAAESGAHYCEDEGGERSEGVESKGLAFDDQLPSNQWAARSCKGFDSSYKNVSGAKGCDPESGASGCARSFFCKRTPIQLLLRYLPFINVLRNYDIKKNLLMDVISGLSVSVLHTGQGLGYSALAGLPPVYGIYVSFFHVAIYFFLGTSNHISVGTYSLTSLLVGAAIDRQVAAITGTGSADSGSHSSSATTTAATFFALNSTGVNASPNVTHSSDGSLSSAEITQLKVGIATTMSFLVGVVLCVLGLLRFGALIANYISPVFISSFTCASAYHIASSQLKYAAFGRHHYIGSYSGPLKLYYLWRDFFVNFLHINWVCSICFLVSMVILFAIKIGINKNPKFRHRLLMPVPVDLIVIVLFTVLSYYLSFETLPDVESGVEIIGKMPVGLPAPAVPSFYNWTDYVGDAFIISVLVFLFNYTMANFFKEKYKYQINENQEMLAPGVYHVISSFFLCFPGSASPPRCFLQDAAGCKTQVSSLISCLILILVLYVMAPYLYYLPFAIIAALICASLKRLMLQAKDLKTLWYQDKIDFAVWVVTFLATFVLDIELGMIVGIGFHLFTVALRVQLNRVYTIGMVDRNIYDDVRKYRLTGRPRDIVVVRYNSPILFVNSGRVVKLVAKVVQHEKRSNGDIEAVVVDCTHVSFIDTAAVKSLVKMRNALKEDKVALFFSGCSPQVRRVLCTSDQTLYHSAFLTIRDVEEHLLAQKKTGERGDENTVTEVV